MADLNARATARLVALVKDYGTQAAAARALGISPAYFGDLLRGQRKFSVAVLAKLGFTVRRVVVAARPEGD